MINTLSLPPANSNIRGNICGINTMNGLNGLNFNPHYNNTYMNQNHGNFFPSSNFHPHLSQVNHHQPHHSQMNPHLHHSHLAHSHSHTNSLTNPHANCHSQALSQSHSQAQSQSHAQPHGLGMAQAPAVSQTLGGINSVLDYDLANMSKFISWCGFGMLKQTRSPTDEFESLIKSVLFATRLPQSTIIVALEYMNQRFLISPIMDHLNDNEIFTFIVTALILANKFNDDNTFTNKSWHGATGLPLSLLNYHESSWLSIVDWNLNVVNFELNIRTLQQCWDTWIIKYGNIDSEPKSPISNCYTPSISHQNYNYSYYPQQLPPVHHQFMQPIQAPPPHFHPGYTQSHRQFYSSPLSSSDDIYDYSAYEPANAYPPHDNAIKYVQSNGFVGYTNPYYNVAF